MRGQYRRVARRTQLIGSRCPLLSRHIESKSCRRGYRGGGCCRECVQAYPPDRQELIMVVGRIHDQFLLDLAIAWLVLAVFDEDLFDELAVLR